MKELAECSSGIAVAKDADVDADPIRRESMVLLLNILNKIMKT